MFYIEGNIGAGKSTFITLFQKFLENDEDSHLLLEPVDSWLNTKDSSGKHILQHYYEDQEKYGFTFQMNAFISRVYEIEEMKKLDKKFNFVERSVYTDRNVFTQLNVDNGNIDEIQHKVYEQWFSVFSEKFDLRPQGYIYLKTTPEICETRIKKRDRSGESSIPLEYLTKLDNLHTEWLKDENQNGTPVLEIDVTEDYTNNEERQKEIFQTIMNFVKNKI